MSERLDDRIRFFQDKADPESAKKPYYDKGGHKSRSDFWKAARRLPWLNKGDLTPVTEAVWVARRDMPRYPRDGKR